MNDTGVHRIRLKGPWQVLPPNANDQEFERHSMPQDWRKLFGETAGTAIFRRNFHTPSRLESHERVIIHVPAGVGELMNFKINDIEISSSSEDPLNFDVTEHLQDFNLLQFSLAFDPVTQTDIPGGLWETVFLEIHQA